MHLIDLYLESDESSMGQIHVVPEFQYHLMAMIRVLMAFVIAVSRSGWTARFNHDQSSS